MINSDTFTRQMLSNPNLLVKATIDAMEASDGGTSIGIEDPNNGFVMQMIANMHVFSKFSEKVDSTLNFFYPQRARNAEQLFTRLSEFDYVKLMASPATLPFVFGMSRAWILENSIRYDDNYNKIQIPETSFITMGGVIYSMYHPIDILVNRNTGAVTAFYSSDKPNNLNVLESNMLIDVQSYVRDGIEIFQITFNMYQFERKQEIITVGSEQGFIKTLSYDDQFYAVKISSLNKAGEWQELKYSLSQMYYDFKTPTAVLSVLSDQNILKVEIPQIYFDNGQISQNIKVEIFTTKGAVNYSLSSADVLGLKANFDPTSSIYAAPLTQMPVWILTPTVIEVVGGSNALSYDEIRDAIVNRKLYSGVAITADQIMEAGRKAGFDLTRVVDDLTERMYFASNILTDSSNMVLPTFAGNILIANESLTGDPSTILPFSDGYYTILPTTVFDVSPNTLVCTPMRDGQVDAIRQMLPGQLVEALNTNSYVRQPFHITLVTDRKSPQAMVYNLLSPKMTSLTFITENAHSAPQMSMTSCKTYHLDNGTGGYQVLLGMTRSSNIESAEISNFSTYVTCLDKVGDFVYLPATYTGTDQFGVDTWEIRIATSYHITTDDYITVEMLGEDNRLRYVQISLNQKFTVVTSFKQSFDPSVPADTNLNLEIPLSRRAGEVAMAKQEMILSLGQNLSSQIYCGVNTSWGNDVYKTADETIYYTTDVPVFQTTEKGLINTRYNATSKNTEVVVLYKQGDTPSNTQDISLVVNKTASVPSTGTTTRLYVDDTTGILVGMNIRGLNIPVGSTVKSFTKQTVTISSLITGTVPSGTGLVATNPSVLVRTSDGQTSASAVVTIPSTDGILIGQEVFGFDIPSNTFVKTVDSANQITLTNSSSVAVAKNTLLTIVNTSAYGVPKVEKGDIVRDPTGQPIIIKSAQNEYLIPSILFDSRLFASNEPVDQTIVKTIAQRLENYANQISTIDPALIEDSRVYYKPARTMGHANYGVGGGQIRNLPLELRFAVTAYVDPAIYNTQTLLSTMSATILTEISKGIQAPTISLSHITASIVEVLGTNVVAVEMEDLFGIDNLRLISLQDRDAACSIESFLKEESDGSISRSPYVTITYVPKPDTSKSTVLSTL